METYSVLMAVYRGEKPEYLRQAVESMLAQTVPPEEFVLVCDGPLTPELEAVIRRFQQRCPALFTLVRLPRNRGLGTALNEGLRRCRNELVARMDSDDLAVPCRMQWQLEYMACRPELSVLGGQIAEFAGDPEQITGYRRVPLGSDGIRRRLAVRSPMNHTTTLLRRSHILRVGGYEPVAGFEDYFLWTRLICGGCLLENLPKVCCRVRADAAMYGRRGGAAYFRGTMRLERFLLEHRVISLPRFCCNAAIRFLGTMVLPVGLRRMAFLLLLRSRSAGPAPARAPEQTGITAVTEG